MKVFLLIALFCLLSVSANAQFVGTFKPGNIYGNPTVSEAPPIDSSTASFGLVTGPASATNGDNACFGDTTGKLLVDCASTARYTVLTANTTVSASNCSQVLYLQGGTQWTLTFPAASSLPAGCIIEVVNSEANYPVGKTITNVALPGSPANSYILYPSQRFRIQNVSSVWTYIQQPNRWVNSNGAILTFYVNNGSGSDVSGVNDGLSPNRAFKTALNAMYTSSKTIDCNGGTAEVQTVVAMAPGSLDTTGIHWSPQGLIGCDGGGSMQVVGASLAIGGAADNGSGLCRLTLAIGATFNGSISGTTLTVQQMSIGAVANGGSAQIAVGAQVTGPGVVGGTVITGFGTGAGGIGTYTINNSQSVGFTSLSTLLFGGGSNYATGAFVMVYGIQGATACNGMWKVTAVDAAHIDLQGSVFSGTYTSGGTITESSGFSGGFNIQLYLGAVVELWNLLFIDPSGGPCISAFWGSKIYFFNGNQFGGCNVADFNLSQNSLVQVEAPYGLSNASNYHLIANTGSVYENAQGIFFMPSEGFTYTTFVLASQGGIASFGGPITLGAGAVVVGKRCEADLLGLVNSGTGTPNTYFPGTINCTSTVGGQYN